jgi:5-methylcytosine-specific restriction endonuclease McrA
MVERSEPLAGSVTRPVRAICKGPMAVFVLDKHQYPLMPCSEKRARLLLKRQRARVHRVYPFTIRLTDRAREDSALQPLRLKIDPGSKASGLALVREQTPGQQHVLHLAEIAHRGPLIRKKLAQRRTFRRRRRGVNLRYRKPRFDNRRKSEGWLAPSLQHRVATVTSWVNRYRSLAPLTSLTMELVRFDTQQLVDPEISGTDYQQGTLADYEVREYLLEKWGRRCAYCDREDLPLQVEHIHPKTLGGSDRVSNLVLACNDCNRAKGIQLIRTYLEHDPTRLAKILAQAETPLSDAAAVNATRWATWRTLQQTGLPLETATGGRTKWNRTRLGMPKAHALDAACAGVCNSVTRWEVPTLAIRCTGRGSHQRTRLTADGFPRGYLVRTKTVQGFRTGDLVRAIVPIGVHAGTYTGRLAIRYTGRFNVQTEKETVQGISWRHCRMLQRGDGYGYQVVGPPPPAPSRRCPSPRIIEEMRTLEGTEG